jgi:prolyl oligopeptidase
LEFKPIIDKWIGDFTFVHNVGTKFFYLTSYKAPFKRLISLDIKFPQEENWKELLVGDKDNILTDVSFIYNKLVIECMTDTASRLKIYDMTSHEQKAILLKEVNMPGVGSFSD